MNNRDLENDLRKHKDMGDCIATAVMRSEDFTEEQILTVAQKIVMTLEEAGGGGPLSLCVLQACLGIVLNELIQKLEKENKNGPDPTAKH